MSQHHPAFELIRQHTIEALNIEVSEYTHKVTGASHYHFASDSKENVFLVGFRTVPMDHKGVAHILEHTALCGSKKYPVRDPFFMMIRRSLNTFMNAFTSNDWTAYPFASTNRKDFFNLLDVYLDATFFSRLDELDFLQEGHRLEFEEADNSDTDLVYKGVVFNEMKGAMSSISSTLWQTLCAHLFSETTYHFNSGGDPEKIPELSYQELTDFYQKHYHPSNAMFSTFGDIDVLDLQTDIEEKALQHFTSSDTHISVGREPRITQPKSVTEYYALDSDNADNQTHLVLSWLLGCNTSLTDIMEAQLLSYVLFENSACPLQHYLETTELGTAPSPLCGLEDSYHELVFCCGIQGADTQSAQTFEAEVLSLLHNIADKGIEPERLNAIVHQLELSQREISGDGYPFGLQVILNALPSVTHRGDPIQLLDLDPVLEKLRHDIQDPNYIKILVKKCLLDNNHRVLLEMHPDQSLSEKREQAEKDTLADIKAKLSDDEIAKIIHQTKALEDRQSQEDDGSILPKVGLDDVPNEFPYADTEIVKGNTFTQHNCVQGTNGLSYQQLIFKLPELPAECIQIIPIYTQCLTELGINDDDFQRVQHRQSETVGSISAFNLMRADLSNEQTVHAYIALSAKALNRNHDAMQSLIHDTLQGVKFTEHDRIKDMISQQRVRKQNSISGAGHSYAMLSATSNLSPIAHISEQWSGLSGIQSIQALDDQLQADDRAIELLCTQLDSLHTLVKQGELHIINISEAEQLKVLSRSNQHHYSTLKSALKPSLFHLPTTRSSNNCAWMCNTQVNFCAQAYPTVPSGHKDAPALTILGGYLRNGFLHTAIREKGGAYGAGATQDSNSATFKFYSYRDPRITGTLEDFDHAIEWMLTHSHEADALEEAVLGVIASIDKPHSPAGEAKQACHNYLFGRSKAQQERFRENVLKTTIDDLVRVTKTYLIKEKASVGIVTSENKLEELESLDINIKQLS